MKIIKKNDNLLIIQRNKRKGVRLKVVQEKNMVDFPCEKCDLNNLNSLCNQENGAICDEAKIRGILNGNLHFKIT
jgi:hypothetical protein